MTAMTKLKTFTTEQGFFELAVAASSRAAALRAWGMKHDLFAQGLARQSSEKSAMRATLAQPGTVLRRPLGSKGEFRTDSELPKVKNVPPKKRQETLRLESERRKKTAEALKELDENYRRQIAALQQELREVQTRISQMSREWKEQRKQLTSSRPKARR